MGFDLIEEEIEAMLEFRELVRLEEKSFFVEIDLFGVKFIGLESEEVVGVGEV